MMGKRRKFCFGPGRAGWMVLGLLGVALILLAFGPASYAQDAQSRVLVLHAYHQGLSWTDNVQAGIEAVLAGEDIDLQIEYMDTKRIFDETYLQHLYQLYRYKFADQRFDVVIASDNNAFNFLRQHGDELFPGTPVVFCGVNFFQDAYLEGHPLFTGVVEATDMRSTLDVALALHPETEQIFVINDTTTTGLAVQNLFEEVRPAYEDRVQFVVYQDFYMADLLGNLSELPDNSLVFLILLNRDKSGQFFTYEQGIELIYAETNVPIYGVWDFYLGHGMVGGMLTNGYSQGEAAADMVLRILDGQDVSDIPVLKQSPNRYMFDYEQLARWGISQSDLPQGSVVINEPAAEGLARYRGWLVAGGIGVLVLSGVVLVLGVSIVRQRRAEEALRLSNVELQEIRSSLEQRVEERTADLESRTAQMQATAFVAREAAAIRDVGQLLEQTVNLISDRFGFYHAGMFLLDERGEYAVLRAASSEGGQRMLARGHKLKVGEVGIVGEAAATGEPHVALDVGEDAVYFDNPDMPKTRSEMALPLKARDQVIGVLDVQSVESEAFSQEDVAVLQILADQVALAVENARLFQEAQERLRETDQLLQRYGQEQWSQLAAERPDWGYIYDGVDVVPRDEAQTEPQADDLVVPLEVRQRAIGRLGLDLGDRSLTPDEAELVQAISEQAGLALENARLFLETQKTLAEVEALYQAGRAIGSATSAQEVAKILVDFASPSELDTARVLFFEQDEHGQPSHLIMSEGWRSDDRPIQPAGTRLSLADYPLADFMDINEPVLTRDVLADPRANEATRNLLRILGLRSFAIIPISIGRRWLGAVFVGRVEPGPFGEDFVRGYQTLAGQAAVALESLRLFQETQRRAERERLIGQVTSRVRETLDLDAVLQSAVREIGEALDMNRVEVRLGAGLASDQDGKDD